VVVRLAGESALVALASLEGNAGLHALTGVVFRDEEGRVCLGAPARPISATGASVSVERHLGFVAADLVVSHGCEAHCSYCCIPAASDLAVKEARRAQASVPSAARYDRLEPREIARAVSALYDAQGVRVISLMDDNVLPSRPEAVTAFARALRGELDARGVPDLAISLQLRADGVSDESADALADLGVVRAYVGIDGYSSAQLRVLGRAGDPTTNRDALARLHTRGILSVANALLVGPTVPFSVLTHEVEALARIAYAPVHLLPHEVRAGTPLFRRAMDRGLVEGGYLHWHYRFADARTARVARLLTSLPTRLAERSVPIALYDLAYNAGIARRLAPHADLRESISTFEEVTQLWNADQVRVVRAALGCADSDAAVDAWLVEHGRGIAETDRAWRRRCDDAIRGVEDQMSAVGGAGPRARAYQRGRLLGAVAFAMTVAACNAPAPPDGGPAEDAGRDAEVETADAIAQDTGCESPSLPDQLPLCGGSYRLSFDAEGRVSDVMLDEDGGTLTTEMRTAILESLAPFCYPSLAGSTQAYTGHCWIA
jgi:hypothetical protein